MGTLIIFWGNFGASNLYVGSIIAYFPGKEKRKEVSAREISSVPASYGIAKDAAARYNDKKRIPAGKGRFPDP